MNNNKHIKLWWCYINNFGDALNPYLIESLTNKKVEFVGNIRWDKYNIKRSIKRALYIIYKRGIISFFKELYETLFVEKILAIGSILSCSQTKCIVWGSGITKRDDYVKGGFFLAVRGPLSQQRLRQLKFEVPDVIGDPAVLLPLIYTKKVSKKFRIGIIPHVVDGSYIKSIIRNENINVIDLGTNDVENVIDKILSCEYIISSSLHGLIVSHAYGIPALWFKFSDLIGEGDNTKFHDYFLSVKLEPYIPFSDLETNINDEFEIENLIKERLYMCLPTLEDLDVMRNELLKVTPFVINNKLITGYKK